MRLDAICGVKMSGNNPVQADDLLETFAQKARRQKNLRCLTASDSNSKRVKPNDKGQAPSEEDNQPPFVSGSQ